MSDNRTSTDRLQKAVRLYCGAVLGERLSPLSTTVVRTVADAACAKTPQAEGPDEERFQQVVSLRRAVVYLHRELATQAREVWPYDNDPPNEGLVQFVVEQVTRPLEELPTKDEVWNGKCRQDAEHTELDRGLLRPVDPLIWATDIRTLRGTQKSLIHLCDAGSIEELDSVATCLLLAERLARKQASVDKFFQRRGTSTIDYTWRAIQTLRIAQSGGCPDRTPCRSEPHKHTKIAERMLDEPNMEPYHG